jgi:hypothetical protein
MEQSISLTNGIDDIRALRSARLPSCCTAYEPTNELMIASVYFSVSVFIDEYVGIRLFEMISTSSAVS